LTRYFESSSSDSALSFYSFENFVIDLLSFFFRLADDYWSTVELLVSVPVYPVIFSKVLFPSTVSLSRLPNTYSVYACFIGSMLFSKFEDLWLTRVSPYLSITMLDSMSSFNLSLVFAELISSRS
jgi:hypothetical protein